MPIELKIIDWVDEKMEPIIEWYGQVLIYGHEFTATIEGERAKTISLTDIAVVFKDEIKKRYGTYDPKLLAGSFKIQDTTKNTVVSFKWIEEMWK